MNKNLARVMSMHFAASPRILATGYKEGSENGMNKLARVPLIYFTASHICVAARVHSRTEQARRENGESSIYASF